LCVSPAGDTRELTIAATHLLLADAPAALLFPLFPGSAEALDRMRRLVTT
jgi:hypothetical protein